MNDSTMAFVLGVLFGFFVGVVSIIYVIAIGNSTITNYRELQKLKQIKKEYLLLKSKLKENEGDVSEMNQMMAIPMAFRNGSISERILKEICQENNWDYKIDEKEGLHIFQKK